MLPGFYEMLRCVTIVPTPRLEGEKKKKRPQCPGEILLDFSSGKGLALGTCFHLPDYCNVVIRSEMVTKDSHQQV
jgi:hypothetical protein